MKRIPLGVSQLDALIGGGAPAGSVVLLSGEAGAGAREFAFTGAAMAGLARENRDLFDLHYGHFSATLPEAVHYVSLSTGAEELRSEMELAMDPELVGQGLDGVQFGDLSSEYFHLSPVPRDWYAGSRGTLEELGAGEERREVIESLADYVGAYAEDSLVVIDSLTDLVSVADGDGKVAWRDVVYLVKGLRKAARRWDGLVLIHLGRQAITSKRLGDLMNSVDGTMAFEWQGTGTDRKRSLVVQEFRGVLSQLENEDIVRFETEITEAGFDIANVRKLR